MKRMAAADRPNVRSAVYNPDQERDEKGRWAPSGDKAATSLDDAMPDAANIKQASVFARAWDKLIDYMAGGDGPTGGSSSSATDAAVSYLVSPIGPILNS